MAEQEMAVESVDSAASVGADSSPVGATEQGVAQESPFFSWKADDGEERVFKKPAELADFLRHSGMRKKDYDTRVSEVTERARHLEEQIKKYEQQQARLTELPLAQWDRKLRENPRLLEKLKRELAEEARDPSTDVQKLLDERLKPYEEKIKEFDRIEGERKAAERRQQVIGRLKERYGDLDESMFEKEMARLMEVPDEDRDYALMELLYHAVRGRETPAEIERRAADKPRRPPSVTSTPGVKNTGRDPATMSRRELAKAAEEALAAKGF